MKLTVPIHLLLLFTSTLASCSNTKRLGKEREMAQQASKIPSLACFVELKDGTIKNYGTLKLVTSVCSSPHLLADGKIKIFPNEIIAYQNGNHFAVAASAFSVGGHKSNIALETLPGFAVRIVAGHLNVYVKKYKTGQHVADEFYLQEGSGQVLAYTPELMDALIKNSPEALDFFNTNRKHIRITKQLKATAYIFNKAYFDKDKQQADQDALAFSGKRKLKK